MLSIMKHCYEHDEQRRKTGINLAQILSGSLHSSRPASTYELNCRYEKKTNIDKSLPLELTCSITV